MWVVSKTDIRIAVIALVAVAVYRLVVPRLPVVGEVAGGLV